jgi:isopenicillin-N N-acyltransferase-like protein
MTTTPKTKPTRFREIEVCGGPREIGRLFGEVAREEVRAYAGLVVERFNIGRTSRLSLEAALDAAAEVIPAAEQYLPDAMEELRGIAEGAGVRVEQVMLINIRNQLGAAAPPEGCTAVLVEPRASASGAGIVAQNWDNDPATDAFSVVLTRRPAGKPAFMTFTRPGEVAYLGLSAAGMGMALNAMPGAQRRSGVPWYFLLRAMYEAASLDAAVKAIERAERAIPANAVVITPDSGADIEITLDALRVLHPDGRGTLVHTNHCVHPDLVSINDRYGAEIYGQSFPRKARAERILGHENGGVTLERVKQLLSDHEGYPTSICRHPNDDPTIGWQRSVVSVILEPSLGRMHLSRGNPCENPYEIYELRA